MLSNVRSLLAQGSVVVPPPRAVHMALGPALTGAAWGPVRNSRAEQGAEGLLEPGFLEQSVVPGKCSRQPRPGESDGA